MRILFALQVPPPLNGSSMVGSIVKDLFEKTKNNKVESKFINICLSDNGHEIGVFKFKKIFKLLRITYLVFFEILVFRPNRIYYAPTITGIGFRKDLINILIIKTFKKSNSKIFYHLHNKGVSRNKNLLDSVLYRYFFKNTNVFLLSEKLYYDIKEYVPAKSVFILPNGIPDIGVISNKNFSNNNSCLVIGFLSNLLITKGIIYLLDSLILLKSNNFKFKCIIAGNEADLSSSQLKDEIKKRNLLNEVEFLGCITGGEKINFFKNLDVFVFPSFYTFECMPIVLLEAAAAGLPIITTNIGATTDIIQNENGFLINPKDSESIFNAFKYIYSSPQIILEMGNKSRLNYEKNFTIEIFKKNLFDNLIRN